MERRQNRGKSCITTFNYRREVRKMSNSELRLILRTTESYNTKLTSWNKTLWKLKQERTPKSRRKATRCYKNTQKREPDLNDRIKYSKNSKGMVSSPLLKPFLFIGKYDTSDQHLVAIIVFTKYDRHSQQIQMSFSDMTLSAVISNSLSESRTFGSHLYLNSRCLYIMKRFPENI